MITQAQSLVILITGASTGFGYRSALQLARAGHTVYATMRDPAGSNQSHVRSLLDTAQNEQLPIRVLPLDVTDEQSVNDAVSIAAQQSGRVDVLLNNAGIWGPGILEAYTMAQWQQVFDINVLGSVRVARAVLPVMRRQKAGLVVQISSLQGRFILPYSGPYVASKFAVEGAMETFRYEVAPYGVEVCIIEPGDFMTEMKGKAAHNMAADTDRAAQYGSVNGFIEQTYLTPDPNRSGDPMALVEAIQTLIDTPAGQRPIRTTVGNFLPQIEQINQLSIEMHQSLFPNMGLGHLLQLGSANQLQ